MKNSKKHKRLDMHQEIENLTGIFLNDSELSKNIGRRCVFMDPTCPAEFDIFTICAVQKLYDNTTAYRVVGDKDEHRFGRPARQEKIKFI